MYPLNRLHILAMLVASALGDMSAAEHPIQATLYVSPEGTENGSSAASPCSLLAARDQVRKINGTMTGDIVVQLAGGVYRMTQPMELLETDTVHYLGNNGFDIIYQACPSCPVALAAPAEILPCRLPG